MTGSITQARLPASYWRLWSAAAVSSVGDGVFAAAVPLLAITVTTDPRLISVVSACTFLPWLLLSLPAGALVDRYDRVALMWRSQAVQAVIVTVMAALAAAGELSVPVLAATAFALGTCEVVFGNASQAILPDIVPKPLLHRANGNQYTVTTIGKMFLGSPVGSLLFSIAVALPFGIDAASFVLSAALLATLPSRRRDHTDNPPLRLTITTGLRWLTSHRLLRTLALLLGVNTFCFQLGNVTLVLLATQTLNVSDRGYGLMLAAGAVGAVVGGTVNAKIVARIGALPTLVTALGANVVVFESLGLSPNAIVLGGLLTANGFLTTLWNVVTVGLRQQLVPSELLGRVNSVYRMLGWGLIPLGALTGGLIAHMLGLRAGYLIAGALRGIALLIAMPVLIGALRARDKSPRTSTRHTE
ncbi:MFS transporter [Pseudonocardia alaniniphila]|uniref:MFS transporter n=1 Tax=Pseudonocardia alaniniphila TaxID=75291 RepID=A0ABS9TRQ9_9PSEU|nr:MFS transporter [Pseudonocardia alaniniphila]MCH6171196.1 MFS transporter [Pseudonocardia alaniniphila]